MVLCEHLDTVVACKVNQNGARQVSRPLFEGSDRHLVRTQHLQQLLHAAFIEDAELGKGQLDTVFD